MLKKAIHADRRRTAPSKIQPHFGGGRMSSGSGGIWWDLCGSGGSAAEAGAGGRDYSGLMRNYSGGFLPNAKTHRRCAADLQATASAADLPENRCLESWRSGCSEVRVRNQPCKPRILGGQQARWFRKLRDLIGPYQTKRWLY